MKIKKITGTLLDMNLEEYEFEAITVETNQPMKEIPNYYEKATEMIKKYIESIN